MSVAARVAGWDLRMRNLPGPLAPAPNQANGEPGAPLATFPAGARQILVELFVGGGWVDITGYVYSRAPVTISRGISSEANVTDPATLALTVDNRDGRFSPRNPTGPYYGLIGRNTPIQVSVAGYWAAGWRTRFYGEVSTWPQRWDPSGNDVWVPLEAAGVLRRLSQGETALRSTLYRRVTSATVPYVAYWPCEDASGSTSIASGLATGKALTVTGTPNYAGYAGYSCSDSIPLLANSTWYAPIPVHTGTGKVQVRFLMSIPAGGATDGAVILRFFVTGTAARWDLVYNTASSGQLTPKVYDASGTLLSPGNFVGGVNGLVSRFSLECKETGSDIDYSISFQTGPGVVSGGGSVLGANIGRITSLYIDPTANLDQVAVGHITVQPQFNYNTDFLGVLTELSAFEGETAAARLLRLGREEGLAVQIVGTPANTSAMGAQRPDTLVNLLRECAATDGGILFEPRDGPGVAYRTRESLYNRPASITVGYHSHQMIGVEPVDDDRLIRNDVTVTRRSGSSARATQSTGTLSTAGPPAGVGRYTGQTQVNTQFDADLADHAGWRLHLGTVDEARYPAVGVNLATPELASDQAQSEAVLDLDVGGRVVITGMPAWLPPDDVSAGVQGLTETLGTFQHEISLDTIPESPWHAAVYDDGISRYTSDGTVLRFQLGKTTTSVGVTTATGPLWTHADGDFDIIVAGERMTVTAVTDRGDISAFAQDFTVVRSVNGVVKSHAGGETVELFRPVFYVI